MGEQLHTALDKFQRFFRSRCRIHWSQRLDEPNPALQEYMSATIGIETLPLDQEPTEESPEEKEARRIFGELAKNPETKIKGIKAFREKEAQRLSLAGRPFVYVRPKPGRPVGMFPPKKLTSEEAKAKGNEVERVDGDKEAERRDRVEQGSRDTEQGPFEVVVLDGAGD